MIHAQGVTLKYGDGTVALKDVRLDIKRGEFIYVIGPSGSGKTSLLKLLMGMEYPTSGSLSVFEQPITRRNAGRIRKIRKDIGPVFQEFKLIRGRTAFENVLMGMRFLNIHSRDMMADARNALAIVGLGHKGDTLVENLSWGEAQRVAIARAVARRPSLILADEPTGNLDQDNAVNILELLFSLKDMNTTVIVTTHATHLIGGYKDASVIRIEKGHVFI